MTANRWRYTYSVPAFHPRSTEDDDLRWSFFVKHYANEEQQRSDGKAMNNIKGFSTLVLGRSVAVRRTTPLLSILIVTGISSPKSREIRLEERQHAPVF